VAAVYQRKLSVPLGLGSVNECQRERWGVNGHTTQYAASAGVRLRANETKISVALLALEARKGLYFLLNHHLSSYLPFVKSCLALI